LKSKLKQNKYTIKRNHQKKRSDLMKRLLLVLSMTLFLTGCVKQTQPQDVSTRETIESYNMARNDYEKAFNELMLALENNDKEAIMYETIETYEMLEKIMEIYDFEDKFILMTSTEMQTGDLDNKIKRSD
jgi:PBP1b-binding outer membrane lipoprotein LpoB